METEGQVGAVPICRVSSHLGFRVLQTTKHLRPALDWGAGQWGIPLQNGFCERFEEESQLPFAVEGCRVESSQQIFNAAFQQGAVHTVQPFL
jgi:hypothetical protein